MYNRITFLFFRTHPVPHSNTGTTGIRKYSSTDFVESIQEAIPFNGITNEFRTGRNCKLCFCFQSFFSYLFGKANRTTDIFIGRIGTTTDQPHFHLGRPAVFSGGFFHLRNWRCQVRGERTIKVWFQFTQVDFNDFIKILFGIGIYFSITGQVFFDGIGSLRHFCTTG